MVFNTIMVCAFKTIFYPDSLNLMISYRFTAGTCECCNGMHFSKDGFESCGKLRLMINEKVHSFGKKKKSCLSHKNQTGQRTNKSIYNS